MPPTPSIARRAFLPLTLTFCAASVGAIPSVTYAAVSPKALALSKSDVTHTFGSQWRTVIAKTVSNAEVQSTSSLAGVGNVSVVKDRITGYLSEFTRNGSLSSKAGKFAATPGPASVTSYVNVYKNGSGPTAALNLARRYKVKKIAGLTYHISSLGGVGDQAVLATTTYKLSSQFPTTYGVTIFFRRGRYLGVVSVSWYGKASTAQTMQLAKVMDGRFQVAG